MMRTTLFLILTCLFFLSAGCANNLLVKRLKDHGVIPDNTAKLKFIGSPGALGGGFYVITEDLDVIKSVWTHIYSATPTNLWAASGFHRVEFYTSREAEQSAATLMLNATDAAYVEGNLWYHMDSDRDGYYGLWRCPALEKLVMWHLRKEYERRKNGP
jgi:hypothetical protein